MTDIPSEARSRPQLLPPHGWSFCPRHQVWERIVEDREGLLCEWCCAPKPCDLHDEEGRWVEEEDVDVDDTVEIIYMLGVE